MQPVKFKSLAAYKAVLQQKEKLESSGKTLKEMIHEENRFETFSCKIDGFFYDYSKQNFNIEIFNGLTDLSRETNARQRFSDMMSGKTVNLTENRAALHTAARDFSNSTIRLGSLDVKKEMETVRSRIRDFSRLVHDQKLVGSTFRAFTDAVVVGIGGSYLGCQFVYKALEQSIPVKMKLHFLSNVDIDNFGRIDGKIDPETTLWIVISKSYTTTETMANLAQVTAYLDKHNLTADRHLVTVTAMGSPGDGDSIKNLDTFYMFDFIGGRYSVTSAVGGVPLSLAFGYDIFKRFLNGCHAMDMHACNAPEDQNIPLIAALTGIWNSNFLNYAAKAVIPYSSALSKLAPHIQQLYMESLGKGVTTYGEPVDYQTGVIIFGEPGTNAQHSFFQLAHQGSVFPIEFIGVVNPAWNGTQALSKGVNNHQELWANLIAQAKALATGQNNTDKARHFKGNRPSSTLLINDLSAESIGKLLAFYEAQTVYEAFILGINPFDQFGVELGKVLASDFRKHLEQKNKEAGYRFDSLDPASAFYLDTLFKGGL